MTADDASSHTPARRRARAQSGERTTLRIPRVLEPAIGRLMSELALTRNEALIALAQRGAAAEEAERRLAEARSRVAEAVLAPERAGPFLTEDEMAAAVRLGRGGRG
jgi:hypothetical protein